MNTNERTDLMAIAISRHRERPADLPVEEDIVRLTDAWFDSTSHLYGQRAVQMLPVSGPQTVLEFHPGR